MTSPVQEKKKKIRNFTESYNLCCRNKQTIPNPDVKVNTSNSFLNLIGDRLKPDDWDPLLEAISHDKSLHFICIKSRHTRNKVSQDINVGTKTQRVNTPKSIPPLTSGPTVLKITESLSKCMSSNALTGLMLERLSLDSEQLNNLCRGLEGCRSLQQLSLVHAQIGDDGCATLCHVLKNKLNLVWLNLTSCNLTDKGVSKLCNLLKFQKLNRYGESWKQSLRYRPVNPDTMPGLRRLTLNNNLIGDIGISIFVDTLIDDLWFKALDLQHCDISEIGAEALLNLVKENKCLSVVDIRNNIDVPNFIVAGIVQQLAANNSNSTPEFQWLKEDNPKSRSGSSIKSRSTHRQVSDIALSRKGLSNTTLSSKGVSFSSGNWKSNFDINKPTNWLMHKDNLPHNHRSILTILPNKSPCPVPHTRASPVKRSQTANYALRLSSHWNNDTFPLKRGGSDLGILSRTKDYQDILNDLQPGVENVNSALVVEKNEKTEPNKSNLSESCLAKVETENLGEDPVIQRDESLESIIRTINGGCLSDSESNCNTTARQSPNSDIISKTPSRAQLLFETLLSS